MNYNFGLLAHELKGIETHLEACTTDEERAMCHMYVANIGKALASAAMEDYQSLTSKCLASLEPRIQ